MKNFILGLVCFLSLGVHAGTPEILVFASEAGGLPAEAMCFFSNNKMTEYKNGIIVHYMCLGGADIYGEIWSVSSDGSRMIARSGMGNLLTDAIVFKDEIYTLEFNELETLKVFQGNSSTTNELMIPSDFKGAHLHDMSARGDILVFRYTGADGEHGEGFLRDGVFGRLPVINDVTYYHVPVSSKLMTVQKLTNESAETIEIRLSPDYAPVTVLQNRAANPASPFRNFFNTVMVQGSYWAVDASTDNGRVIVVGHGREYKVMSLSSFRETDYWGGAITTSGEYILRATDKNDVRGLWLLRETPVLLFTSGVEIKLETKSITVTKKSLFYNSPVINQNNELFIGVGLGNTENGEVLGQGILKIKL